MSERCVGPKCEELSESNVAGIGPLCQGHRKQHIRGKKLKPLRAKTPRERLHAARDEVFEACHRLADAKSRIRSEIEELGMAWSNADSEGEVDFRAAQRNFWSAMDDWARVRAREKGWR
jgi:hypothetical protein